MFCCTKLTNSNPEDELATLGVGVTEWRKYSIGGCLEVLMASLLTSYSVQPPVSSQCLLGLFRGS